MRIRDLPCFVYDIEVFKNVFHCTLINTETEEIIKFECSERKNEITEMCNFFVSNKAYFVGYNNIHYDNVIINYCIDYFFFSNYSYARICESLFNLSKTITLEDSIEKYKKWKYANYFKTLDLLTMLYSLKLRVSLKQLQVTMMYKNVQEYNVDWDTPLLESQIDDMIAYNINDVLSTYELLKKCKSDIELRLNIEDTYHIDCLSKDGVNTGMQILASEYMAKTGISWQELKDLRSPADYIDLSTIILPFIDYKMPILKNLLTEMKSMVVSPERKGFEKQFILDDLIISVGVGGIHSINTPEIFIPNEDELLIDCDVASLYPSMLLNFNFYPKHLGKEFKEVYADIRERRLKAKKEKNKVVSDTLKLSLNGLSGNLQNAYSWCYDPTAVMGIRINGQLLLLMLAERLLEHNAKLIQLNTDGIFFKCNKLDYAEINKACKEWENLTGLELEEDRFKSFYQFAINDYFGVQEDGKIKEKGLFTTKVILGKGLEPKIIPKAVEKYFLEGINPTTYIKAQTDIKDFLMSEKTGKQWHVEYDNKEIQRTNRFYASTDGKFLYKWKEDKYGNKEYQLMLASSGVTILNNFDDLKENPKINYRYYISEANKIIDLLQNKQLSLF